MKTLHGYLTRQILASLLMTVVVFTFVLLLGNALKDVLPLLVNGQVGFGVVAQAVGLLVPFVAVFALPMGTLAATLLIFGRFSADQEYTAVRASGISLVSLVSPILLLSVLLCGVSALVNMEIGPRCRVACTTILSKLRAQLATGFLPEGRFITEFPGYIFYTSKNRQGELENVIVLVLQNETNVQQTVHATHGKVQYDAPTKKLNVTLFGCQAIPLGSTQRSIASGDEMQIGLDLEQGKKGPQKTKVDDMTFTQLRQERRQLAQWVNLKVPMQRLTKEQEQTWRKEREQWRKDLSVVTFHIHKQVAFSFACFGFTLIGIPLGLRVHRRETNIGIAGALILALIYYSFILIGQALNTRPEYAPYLIVWIPNFLFQAVGALLLWRANHGP